MFGARREIVNGQFVRSDVSYTATGVVSGWTDANGVRFSGRVNGVGQTTFVAAYHGRKFLHQRWFEFDCQGKLLRSRDIQRGYLKYDQTGDGAGPWSVTAAPFVEAESPPAVDTETRYDTLGNVLEEVQSIGESSGRFARRSMRTQHLADDGHHRCGRRRAAANRRIGWRMGRKSGLGGGVPAGEWQELQREFEAGGEGVSPALREAPWLAG